ncbi:MAG: hypothetical protein U0587_09060 [Candidatus Binatia bacterium]
MKSSVRRGNFAENAAALTKEMKKVERKQAAAENLRELTTQRDTLPVGGETPREGD